MMEAIFITLTGTAFRYGHDFLEPGMGLLLKKEPENEHDREAIEVKLEGLGRIGYVANSPRTVQGESYSAGRLYDKIGDTALARVEYILPNAVICLVSPSSLLTRQRRSEEEELVAEHAFFGVEDRLPGARFSGKRRRRRPRRGGGHPHR